jgi:hypothetical protein
MNNIKNTMCRLADLTQEQIDSLADNMPIDNLTSFNKAEKFIGFNTNSYWGTFCGGFLPKIVTYTEMMQLLKGKDMNKQTAQEQMAVMQIEMDKLKAIIDKQEAKPEVKTGRVLSLEDIGYGVSYWTITMDACSSTCYNDSYDKTRIEVGLAFHDEETAKKHIEYLKLEQELRRAQIADGGAGEYKIVFDSSGVLMNSGTDFFHKICFKTDAARRAFKKAHTDEQLTLLIRGV